jgi:hypothetical protein
MRVNFAMGKFTLSAATGAVSSTGATGLSALFSSLMWVDLSLSKLCLHVSIYVKRVKLKKPYRRFRHAYLECRPA